MAVVQVTKESIRVIDFGSGFLISSWEPPTAATGSGKGNAAKREKRLITTASVNPTQILVGLEGGSLIYLTLDEELNLVQTWYVFDSLWISFFLRF